MDKTINYYSADVLRRTSLGDWFEIYRSNCLICNKTGNCMINKDGKTIACTRVESKIQFSKSNPSWIHYLNSENSMKIDPSLYSDSGMVHFKIAEDVVLDRVYNIVLDYFGLLSSHREHLTKDRKLSDKTIHVRKYGSFYRKKQEIISNGKHVNCWELLFKKNKLPVDIWKGVPGFHAHVKEDGTLEPVFTTLPGILIPYRNRRSQITGLQVRVNKRRLNLIQENHLDRYVTKHREIRGKDHCLVIDKGTGEIIVNTEIPHDTKVYKIDELDLRIKANLSAKYIWVASGNKNYGTRANASVHLSVNISCKHNPTAFFVTEGALKGDIISEYLSSAFCREELENFGFDTICTAGVNQYQKVLDFLEQFPDVKKITTGYDMDFISKPEVSAAYKKFLSELISRGYSVRIATWSLESGKGLDDCLINGFKPVISEI